MKKSVKLLFVLALAAFAAVGCRNKNELESYLDLNASLMTDKTSITATAENPADEAIMVTSTTDWLVFTPKWVTAEPDHGNGNGVVTIRIQENKAPAARSGEIRVEGGGKVVSIPITQEEYVKHVDPDASIGGINSKEELFRFARAVNEGTEELDRWMDATGHVLLLEDIDITGETWTPIGEGTFTTSNTISGKAFSGTFDGQGHKIKGLKIEVPESAVAGYAAGFFGVLSNATVKGLTVEADAVSHTTDLGALGSIAGYAIGTTFENCSSEGSLSFDGKSSARFCLGGIVGAIASDADFASIVRNCANSATLKSENTTNTGNGAGGYSIGGLIGFSDAKATVSNEVTSCVNNGKIDAAATRVGGIIASANKYTKITSCTNNGAVECRDVTATNSRAGGIASATGAEVYVTSCVNNGNVTFTVPGDMTHGYVAGIVGQVNSAVDIIDGCENYGTIRSDMWYNTTVNSSTGLPDKFMGIITASLNSYAVTVKNCKIGGKIGPYTEDDNNKVVDITAGNFMEYISLNGYRNRNGIFENNTYIDGSTPPEPPVDPLPDPSNAKLKILFIGNSFTKDAVEHMPGLLAAAGIKDVKMVHMYYGGHLVSQYNNEFKNASGYHCYTCLPGSTSWTETTGVSIYDAVRSDTWDIVTIQEHTGNAAAWVWNDTQKAAYNGLIDKVKEARPDCSPKFWYIMSQAYFDMSKIGSGSQPSVTWTDQAGMFSVITSVGQQVMRDIDFTGIIPTGTMLQNLRTSYLDNEMNLTRDGYHMDYGISRYGASCTVFESIITPTYNIKLDDNSYRYSNSNTTSGSYSTPVTSTNAPVALQAARYAIAKPFEVTDMSSIEEEIPDNGIGDIDYEEGDKE